MITTDTFPKHVIDAANQASFSLRQLQEYTNGIYQLLSGMEPGSDLEISSVAKTRTTSLFIEVAKLYHDEIGGINFNSNYTHIHKLSS